MRVGNVRAGIVLVGIMRVGNARVGIVPETRHNRTEPDRCISYQCGPLRI